jgi:hypothetical protein
MGQVKKLIEDAIERGYAYSKDHDYGYDKQLVADAIRGREILRNERWHMDMPDLTGQALADAEREFLETVNEADDMPLWIQLELDLWEGQHGINEQTYWDVAGRGSCE